MTKARLDGLYLLLLGSVVFVLLGTVLASTSPVTMADFRGLYFPARCLTQHCDPYNEGEVISMSRAEGGYLPWDTVNDSHFARYVYFPTAFCLTVPFAMLPWGPAHLLWLALILAGLTFASFLIWTLGADYAPIISGVLIGFLLADSELLVVFGNMAGIAISLCVVAVWCFLRGRFVLAGVLCLAISLAVKPHDAGLVWLYFLLAGGVYRKRALQTLLVTAALSLPGLVWVWLVAPHWMQELHFNIQAFMAHGATDDAGLGMTGTVGMGMVISLQSVFSAFWNDPRFYNMASYLLITPLLLVWVLYSLRYRPSLKSAWLALAAIAALSMLPVYHRQLDAKLLLLTVPACAMLWAEGGVIGRMALLVNAAGFAVTADLPWAILTGAVERLHPIKEGPLGQILIAVQVFPVPLTLLAMGVFYLWVYVRRSHLERRL